MFTTCAFYFQNNISRMIFRLNAVKTVKNTHCGYIKLINDNKLINGITYNLIWRGTEVSAVLIWDMNSWMKNAAHLRSIEHQIHFIPFSRADPWPLSSRLWAELNEGSAEGRLRCSGSLRYFKSHTEDASGSTFDLRKLWWTLDALISVQML